MDITLSDSIKGLSLILCHMRERVFAASQRWRTARLNDYKGGSDLQYAPLCGQLPLLEFLDFKSLQPMGEVILAFKDCPHLVHINLSGVDACMIELPAKQLTYLYLYNYWPVLTSSLRTYSNLLSQCSLLEVLWVVSSNNPGPDARSCPP